MSLAHTCAHQKLLSVYLRYLCSAAVLGTLHLYHPPIDLISAIYQCNIASIWHAWRHLGLTLIPDADFHPDELYRVHTSTEESVACHRGKGLAGSYGAEKTDCDSPFSLVNATFAWIEENLKDDIDFVIWTGDSARHDSDEQNPRHEPEILRTNRAISDKFVETFSTPEHGLSIPVVPTFGNNDFLPHNIMLPGPNKWFAAYSDIWSRFIPEEQRHSFTFGGWFYVEVIPNRLAVFSLNTMYFFDRNAGVDGCAHPSEPGYKHLDWLRVQLQILRERGVKAILIGHVPPARTESKQNWDETCWQKYTLWLKQYRDVVVGSLYGHMNIDHFLLQDVKDLTPELGLDKFDARGSPDESLSISSKEDYLQELRDVWAELPKSVARDMDQEASAEDDEEIESGKKKKGRKHRKKKKKKLAKIGGKYAERYQLSLISPSVVPNYFPTLRVVEYNITGIEDTPVWRDTYDLANLPTPLALAEEDTRDYENLEDILVEIVRKKGKKSKGPRKPPKDHDLIVPLDPPKSSLPGPAYAPQVLTMTGYTQYFANLTHINDDIPDDDVGSLLDINKWRKGKHDEKEPKHGKPNPRDFQYEVEYNTFTDKMYKLPDLTVKSFLKLAYKMGQKDIGGKSETFDAYDEDETSDTNEFADGDMESMDKKDKNDKGKNKKNKKEKNKTWLTFLSRAFVGTVPKEELEKM